MIVQNLNQLQLVVKEIPQKLVTQDMKSVSTLLASALKLLESLQSDAEQLKTDHARWKTSLQDEINDAKKDLGNVFNPKNIAKGEFVPATKHAEAVKKLIKAIQDEDIVEKAI